MVLFLISMVSAALGADARALPCVFTSVKPEGCDGNVACVRVENIHKSKAIAPMLEGFCSLARAVVQEGDAHSALQVIFDPASRPGFPQYISVIAPKGSAYMYFPAGTTSVRMAGVAYGGSFGRSYLVPVTPTLFARVFDDDGELDTVDHHRLGTCLWQTIELGTRYVQFGATCSDPELAKSRR